MPGRAYIEDILYGRRRAPVIGFFLGLLSVLYGAAIRLRAGLYACGVLGTKKLPVPVISVGNITLGGTGKTPAVIALVGMLRERGKRPVVVSRGYGRTDESAIVVVSDGAGNVADTDAGGDEPVLIGKRLPDVPVVAGSDRFRAGKFAQDRFRPGTIVLDDGYQHLRLKRDLNIALVDGADPFGNGKVLPAGILREPLSALRRARAVVITRSDRCADLEWLRNAIRRNSRAELFTARSVPRNLLDIATGEARPLSCLRGTPVFAFSGIARPEPFHALLASLGCQVKGTSVYPDHHTYTTSDLANLFQAAVDRDAVMLVTTEKDGVRLKGIAREGIWALRIDLEVQEREAWERLIGELA